MGLRLALREIRLLKCLDHPLIIRLHRAFFSRNCRLYAVFPYIDGGCSQRILKSRYPRGLPPVLLKSFAWQLCIAVRYLHNQKVLHRDIKPANILLSCDGTIRLCDFGFARRVADLDAVPAVGKEEEVLTPYIQTRPYRAPEVLLGQPYGAPSDIWALGATLAEMATGEVLLPGTSSLDQLWHILGALPGPRPPPLARAVETLQRLDPAALGDKFPAELLRPKQLPGRPLTERLAAAGAGLEPDLVEFISACLRLDASARPNADELLRMPWLAYGEDVGRLVAGNPVLESLHRELAAAAPPAGGGGGGAAAAAKESSQSAAGNLAPGVKIRWPRAATAPSNGGVLTNLWSDLKTQQKLQPVATSEGGEVPPGLLLRNQQLAAAAAAAAAAMAAGRTGVHNPGSRGETSAALSARPGGTAAAHRRSLSADSRAEAQGSVALPAGMLPAAMAAVAVAAAVALAVPARRPEPAPSRRRQQQQLQQPEEDALPIRLATSLDAAISCGWDGMHGATVAAAGGAGGAAVARCGPRCQTLQQAAGAGGFFLRSKFRPGRVRRLPAPPAPPLLPPPPAVAGKMLRNTSAPDLLQVAVEVTVQSNEVLDAEAMSSKPAASAASAAVATRAAVWRDAWSQSGCGMGTTEDLPYRRDGPSWPVGAAQPDAPKGPTGAIATDALTAAAAAAGCSQDDVPDVDALTGQLLSPPPPPMRTSTKSGWSSLAAADAGADAIEADAALLAVTGSPSSLAFPAVPYRRDGKTGERPGLRRAATAGYDTSYMEAAAAAAAPRLNSAVVGWNSILLGAAFTDDSDAAGGLSPGLGISLDGAGSPDGKYGGSNYGSSHQMRDGGRCRRACLGYVVCDNTGANGVAAPTVRQGPSAAAAAAAAAAGVVAAAFGCQLAVTTLEMVAAAVPPPLGSGTLMGPGAAVEFRRHDGEVVGSIRTDSVSPAGAPPPLFSETCASSPHVLSAGGTGYMVAEEACVPWSPPGLAGGGRGGGGAAAAGVDTTYAMGSSGDDPQLHGRSYGTRRSLTVFDSEDGWLEEMGSWREWGGKQGLAAAGGRGAALAAAAKAAAACAVLTSPSAVARIVDGGGKGGAARGGLARRGGGFTCVLACFGAPGSGRGPEGSCEDDGE